MQITPSNVWSFLFKCENSTASLYCFKIIDALPFDKYNTYFFQHDDLNKGNAEFRRSPTTSPDLTISKTYW